MKASWLRRLQGLQCLQRLRFALVSQASAATMFTLVQLCASTAHAHELSMGEMEVRQLSPEQFVWHWSAGDKQPAAQELTPRWPQGCSAVVNLLS